MRRLPIQIHCKRKSRCILSSTEHRDVKQPGLSYEDDSMGNALAAMVKSGLIEFRFHKAFSDDRVRSIAQAIINHPDVAFMSDFLSHITAVHFLAPSHKRLTSQGSSSKHPASGERCR
jgi:hypothetical protein